jgi:hypothetical protein
VRFLQYVRDKNHCSLATILEEVCVLINWHRVVEMGVGVSNLWVQIIPTHGNLHNLLLQIGFGKTHSLSLQLTQKIVHFL